MLSASAIIAEAKNKTGLNSWGQGPDVDYWLDLLITDFNNLKTAPIFEDHFRQHFRGVLERRLQLAAVQPKATPLAQKPVVIIGLKRSGTSLLQQLLSLQPGWRSPTVAEAIRPVQMAAGGQQAEAAHEWAANFCKTINQHLLTLKSIHYFDADTPEENRVLLAPSLVSRSFTDSFYAPNYAQALETTDFTDAYMVMLRTLNLLSDHRRWVLKDPHHMGAVNQLNSVMPSHIVWIHRDPIESIPSACSLQWQTQIKPNNTTKAQVGETVLENARHTLQQTHKALSEVPDVTHVSYTELLANPERVVDQIIQVAGDIPDFEAMRKWLDQNPQHKYGKHHYTAEEFGLTAKLIQSTLDGLW